jgi:hypothetical protein
MAIQGAFAIQFQAGTSQSISGYDNETGNNILQNTLVGFPANSTNNSFSLAFNIANCEAVFLLATQNCTLTTNNTNTADVQTFTITGTPTGGTFPIAWNANGTVVATSVLYNANAATLQTALQTLAGTGNVNCTGGPLPGTAINATFSGSLNTGKQPVFVVSNSQLTGGTTPNVTVTHAVVGSPTDTISLVAGIPRIWGASQGYGLCPFTGNVNSANMTCNAALLLSYGILTT